MAQNFVDQALEDQKISSSIPSLFTSSNIFSSQESASWNQEDENTMNNNYENLDNISFEMIRNKSFPYSSVTLSPSSSEINSITRLWDNETSTQLINSLNTTAQDEIEFYYFYKTEQLTFLWVLFAMIVFGNSSVLITLLMSKNRKTRMNFFIMHLAIADLMVGIISVLTDIAWRTTIVFHGGNIACKTVKFFQVLVTYSSTYVLVSLNIDRYYAIRHPLSFSGSWTRARLLVASAWGLSAIFSIPTIFLNKETMIKSHTQCWIDLDPMEWRVYITIVALSLFFFPTIIISACYSIIVQTIWTKSRIMGFPKTNNKSHQKKKHTSSVPKNGTNDGVGGQNSSASDGKKERYSNEHETDFKRASSRGVIPRAKIKTVKMTFVIVFVFILCWSPYFVWDLLQVYGYIPLNQTTIAVSTFIQSMAPLNSAANPIIYCLFSTHVCKNLRKFPISQCLSRAFCSCCPNLQSRPFRGSAAKKRVDYATINSTTTHSSGRTTTTQRFSLTSMKSSHDSTFKKTVVFRCSLDEVPENGNLITDPIAEVTESQLSNQTDEPVNNSTL